MENSVIMGGESKFKQNGRENEIIESVFISFKHNGAIKF